MVEYPAKRRDMAKTELWGMYWQINAVKAALFIVRCRNSLHRWDRELVRRLEEAWGA